MNKEKEEKNKGITLISLVLTIIILLILAGVSLSLVVGETGIVERASKTKNVTETAELQEKIKIAAMAAQVEGLGTIPSIDVLKSELDSAIGTDYTIEETDEGWQVIANKTAFNIDKNGGTEKTEYFDAEEWDKTAVPETAFIWESDTQGDEGYNTIIGYKADISNYTTLKFPSRCKKISIYFDISTPELFEESISTRTFTKNIVKIEIPPTISEIERDTFGEYNFESVQEISIPNTVTSIGAWAFSSCGIDEIIIPKSVINIEDRALDCKNLKNINVDSDNNKYASENGILFDKSKNTLIRYPRGKEETVFIIPNNVKEIGTRGISRL